MNRTERGGKLLGPVLAGFFIMGFCDLVAPITGRIGDEFPVGQQGAVSFLPTMVFLWFLVLSTPVAALMNRWGRKATALVGYGFTIAGMLVPYAAGAGCSLVWYFVGFGLHGSSLLARRSAAQCFSICSFHKDTSFFNTQYNTPGRKNGILFA